ncbi:MAG TPA: LCP family protein [Nocardioidaceae bacterium]|nr:LCP family protein [Nocardioidaceae bacterium]
MTETAAQRNQRNAARSQSGRSRRADLRRAQGLPGTLGITALSAVLPGSGFIFAGRRTLGLLVLLPTLLVAVLGGWYAATHVRSLLRTAVDPDRLTILSVALITLLVAWVAVVVATYRMVRPLQRPRWHNYVGAAFVVVLCLLVSAPLAVGARYSMVQADLVNSVFQQHTHSATRPTVTAADPWGDQERVNVLLLGGDGGVNRMGIRTDTVIVASMDVDTGETVLFSLPRNLMNVPFPEDSPLHKLYPHGFSGDGPDAEYMLNAIYRNVPAMHPGVLGRTDNPGADALKLGVSAALGIDVDYYLLVNLAGFEQIVDAMGGVTVNINEPIPIGGNTDLGIEPKDYLEPGPDQHLNGFEALWFARGRYGSDDYERMERQRCMIDAIVDKAEPVNLLRRYQELAKAGKEILRTDIPQDLLPAFVDLLLKVKDQELESVVFRSSEQFTPGDPDYDWVHATVQEAIDPPEPTHAQPASHDSTTPEQATLQPAAGAGTSPDQAVEAADSCAYDPVE